MTLRKSGYGYHLSRKTESSLKDKYMSIFKNNLIDEILVLPTESI